MEAVIQGKSGPARGLWIEIIVIPLILSAITSGPARGLWIEIARGPALFCGRESGPARGLWIEIKYNELL